MARGERKAVLVLPDLGLSEEQVDKCRAQFQNNIVGTLERAGANLESVVVVVVVVFAE